MKLVMNLILLTLLIGVLTGCGGRSEQTSPSDGNMSDYIPNFSETTDTELTEEARKVDLAETLADVQGCEKIEESKVTFDTSLVQSFGDVFMGAETQKKNFKKRFENLARIEGAKKGANRVRLIGENEGSWTSTGVTQFVAFYSCN
jgi:uncharacterized protein YceK